MDKPQETTGERPPSKTKAEIIREAKRIEEALLYSSKGHFAASQDWKTFHLWIGVPMVILSAIAGASSLSQFDPKHIVAGLLAIGVAGLGAVITFLNPHEKVAAHLNAGNNYDSLMNKVRIFWSIEASGTESDQILTDKLKHFSEQKDKLNQSCPQIPRRAYKKARKGISSGEGHYAVDDEKPSNSA